MISLPSYKWKWEYVGERERKGERLQGSMRMRGRGRGLKERRENGSEVVYVCGYVTHEYSRSWVLSTSGWTTVRHCPGWNSRYIYCICRHQIHTPFSTVIFLEKTSWPSPILQRCFVGYFMICSSYISTIYYGPAPYCNIYIIQYIYHIITTAPYERWPTHSGSLFTTLLK